MKVKYIGKSGKREIRICLFCSCSFETLSVKVRAGGEKFCSRECYFSHRTANKKSKDTLFDNKMYQKKYKYGLTKDKYSLMVNHQNNKCLICGYEFNGKSKYTTACVDHCHTTKKVRGLLCQACNRGLGAFKDNIKLLNKAAKYLKDNGV